jgi:hypothetical protein
MKKTIHVGYENGQWKVTNVDGEWATAPDEATAIRTAQFTAKDFPTSDRPQIVVKGKDGKTRTL